MSRSTLVTVLVAAAGVGVVAALALLVLSRTSHPLDLALIRIVRDPALLDPLAFLRVVTELGSTWAVTIVAVLTVLIGVALGPWLHGLIGAGVIGAASIGNGVIKAIVARERPDLLEAIVNEPGYSFPSGHAALGMVAWGVLAVLVWRSDLGRPLRSLVVALLAVLVFLIGLSRVYLGVHYPTDVVAGWIAGAVVVFLFARLTRAVPTAPAGAAVDEDRAAPRSGPPATG